MREIKFRGQRIDKKKWVYGYYFVEAVDNEDRLEFDHLSFIKEIYGDLHKDYQVILESVGQFTGLCDKNGKEIYEEDILKVKDVGTLMLVEWHNNSAGFNLAYLNKNECEVVGNIFSIMLCRILFNGKGEIT